MYVYIRVDISMYVDVCLSVCVCKGMYLKIYNVIMVSQSQGNRVFISKASSSEMRQVVQKNKRIKEK